MLSVLFCFCNLGKNRCCCRFQLGQLNDHLFGKELFIRLTVRVSFVGVGKNLAYVILLVFRVRCGM